MRDDRVVSMHAERLTETVTPVHGLPLRDVVREKIRTRIAEGEWGPGTRLVERDLAEEFQVSQVPVREALRALESEGFVDLLPRRGAVVRDLTRSVVSDLFDIRQVLEGLVARLVADRVDDDGLAPPPAVPRDRRRAPRPARTP